MTMPMPKMSKAHRMYLYGVLTTGVVCLVVAGLTIAVSVMEEQRPQSVTAMDVIKNSIVPGVALLPPQPGPGVTGRPLVVANQVDGWVKSSDAESVVIDSGTGDRMIRITSDTTINLLDANSINPIQQHPIDASSIPVNMLAHITLLNGTHDVAAQIVVVKNHD